MDTLEEAKQFTVVNMVEVDRQVALYMQDIDTDKLVKEKKPKCKSGSNKPRYSNNGKDGIATGIDFDGKKYDKNTYTKKEAQALMLTTAWASKKS